MCDTCGCNITAGNKHLIQADGKLAKTESGAAAIDVLTNLLSENDLQAKHNRDHFDTHQVLVLNLMSSPGSGKTTLLESSIDALKHEFNIAVIEGDLETENDAERIRAKGVTAIQITTGSACHLDAHMVHAALHHIDLAPLDIVFIENVGNLVCPASFDLGHHYNVTLLSVTEGDDKPAKYPVMFRAADLMLLSKSDLLSVIGDFDPGKAEHYLRQLANAAPVIPLSCRSGDGLVQWTDWLRQQVKQHQHGLSMGERITPKIQTEGQGYHAENHDNNLGRNQHSHDYVKL